MKRGQPTHITFIIFTIILISLSACQSDTLQIPNAELSQASQTQSPSGSTDAPTSTNMGNSDDPVVVGVTTGNPKLRIDGLPIPIEVWEKTEDSSATDSTTENPDVPSTPSKYDKFLDAYLNGDRGDWFLFKVDTFLQQVYDEMKAQDKIYATTETQSISIKTEFLGADTTWVIEFVLHSPDSNFVRFYFKDDVKKRYMATYLGGFVDGLPAEAVFAYVQPDYINSLPLALVVDSDEPIDRMISFAYKNEINKSHIIIRLERYEKTLKHFVVQHRYVDCLIDESICMEEKAQIRSTPTDRKFSSSYKITWDMNKSTFCIETRDFNFSPPVSGDRYLWDLVNYTSKKDDCTMIDGYRDSDFSLNTSDLPIRVEDTETSTAETLWKGDDDLSGFNLLQPSTIENWLKATGYSL